MNCQSFNSLLKTLQSVFSIISMKCIEINFDLFWIIWMLEGIFSLYQTLHPFFLYDSLVGSCLLVLLWSLTQSVVFPASQTLMCTQVYFSAHTLSQSVFNG